MASRDGDNRPDGHRRKWDRNEYEKKAKARAREERGDNTEDQEYSKRSNAKKESKHHTDRNPREKATETTTTKTTTTEAGPPWAVSYGQCTVNGAGCVMSPNYPSDYDNKGSCVVSVLKD